MRAAAGGCEGDGFGPRNVSLGLFRGEIRLPWPAPRQQAGAAAMGCSEGDGIGPRGVSLGPSRAVHVAKGPKGETLDAREFSPGPFRGFGRLPWTVPRHLAGRSATRTLNGDGFGLKNVALGRFCGEIRRPWPVPCRACREGPQRRNPRRPGILPWPVPRHRAGARGGYLSSMLLTPLREVLR